MFKILLSLLSCLLLSSSYAQFTNYNLSNTGEPVNYVTSIGVLNSGYVYVGTDHSGVVEFDGLNSWNTFNISTVGFPNDYITSIYINSTTLWIGTQFGGVGKYDGTTWSSITTSNSLLPVNEVWGMQIDTKGDLCIATYQGFAVDSIPKSSWKIFNITNTPALETQSFYCIYTDLSNGDVWLGTHGNGIAKFSSNTWQFYKTQSSNIINDTVNVIKKSSDGNLWIGTDVGLSKFDGTTWTNYSVSSTGGDLPGDKINSIAFDSDGNMFVATGGGLGILNKASGLWSHATTLNSDIPENNITAVAVDPNTVFDDPNAQEVWIGTASMGVARAHNDSILLLTSIKKEQNIIKNFIAYPNPVSQILNLKFRSEKQSDYHIALVNILGEKILDLGTYIFGLADNIISKDFSNIEKGIYLLVIESEGQRFSEKIQVY